MRRGLVRGSSTFGTLSEFACLLIVSSAQFNGFCSTFREVFLHRCFGVQGSSISEEGRAFFIPLAVPSALLSFLTFSFSLLQNMLLLPLTKIS